jgi:hypothetical protein
MLGGGLFQLVDACPRLEQLDLSGCRGVNVIDRRRFFEVSSALYILARITKTCYIRLGKTCVIINEGWINVGHDASGGTIGAVNSAVVARHPSLKGGLLVPS